jgi:hypothetical protein
MNRTFAHIEMFDPSDRSDEHTDDVLTLLNKLGRRITDKLTHVSDHKGCWRFVFKNAPTLGELKELVSAFNYYFHYDSITRLETPFYSYGDFMHSDPPKFGGVYGEPFAGTACGEKEFFDFVEYITNPTKRPR